MSTGVTLIDTPRLYDRVPLATAALCEDCGMISNAPDGMCPECASLALLRISGVLNRKKEVGDSEPNECSEGCDCGEETDG